MKPSEEPRKAELIERLAAEARRRVDPAIADAASEFVRRYYALVAPDDMLYTPPDVLVESALSLWRLGAERIPGTPNIHLYNPALEREGWTSEHTVLEIVNDDMPFLVDSIAAELNLSERNIHVLIHPIVQVRRDSSGRRIDTASTEGQVISESYIHVELDQVTSESDIGKTRECIEKVLSDVRTAVADWQSMRMKLREVLEELNRTKPPLPLEEIAEAMEFLRWLDDDHFVYLGYRRYHFTTTGGEERLELDRDSSLGVLRAIRPESANRSNAPFPQELRHFAHRKELLVVAKANTRSTVHRPVHMDRISVKRFDDQGNVIGEDRFLGLFTSGAYSRSVKQIPLLRHKARRVLERAGLSPTSHDGKALAAILETLPRDEVFQMDDDQLYNTSLGILQLQERLRIALFVRQDVFERFVSCLVYIPRDRFDADVRERIQDILERAFNGIATAAYAQLSESPLARAHYIIKTSPGEVPEVDAKLLEAQIAEAARTWSDHLRDALIRVHGEEAGIEIHRRYRDAFPAGYRERFAAEEAVHDIGNIEKVLETSELVVDLYDENGPAKGIRCKFMHRGSPLSLSDIVPRLENLGLRVELAEPFEVRPTGAPEPVRIRDFAFVEEQQALDVEQVKPNFEEAFLRIWHNETEDDGFNRLITLADLEWQQVVVLRTYCKYLRQTGISFSQAYMQRTMANHAEIACLLVELFESLFDPARAGEGDERADQIRGEILRKLESVTNLDEDRIIRRYLNAIDSTVRTNYYQPDAAGLRKAYLSIKISSRDLTELPLPRPLFEIFVYSPRFEGVHLRGGMVARGGIRWSDRPEDFRTEILGLMKAQTVKNTVIVPVGSKGGFVLKQAPSPGDREAFLKEGIACYQNFIRGLLDLTDNIVDGRVVHPPNVRLRDADDIYLVVAADKGTATFSDIANGISAEYDFWLGDAFASGGSAGYDHKKMGITARGAWEAVKRHFRELGRDIQTQNFTCVGVGDMSGDVFGNGMLLSEHTRLIGAFNHLHIFVDPDPDPRRSFEERKRLFELPRSSWSDYDPSLLSPGGAVFDRKAKLINISPQVMERFDLPKPQVTPNELVQAILRARADLLWLGGIGTYVKASDETDADARDRANDALRVDAPELRVKVVGEGANLGCTQRARIEFALGGGKINNDAIDNSAGVDTSDHEVNIKILLDELVRRGGLTGEQRLEVLAEMTSAVAELVLRDNYQQTQAISIAAAPGVGMLDAQARLMRSLERAGKLDRGLEFLPDDEVIVERHAAHTGLTRPEIAVLLAYSKIALYQDLLGSDLPDDPLLHEDLIHYFPPQLRERYPDAILRHRLNREIIATFVTNNMVNRVGPTFVTQLSEETGRTSVDIARAYAIVRNCFELRSIYGDIESLDNLIPAELQLRMLLEAGQLVERATRWFLKGGVTLDVSTLEAEYRPGIATLQSQLDSILSAGEIETLTAKIRELEELGVPSALARRIGSVDVASSFLDIVHIAHESGQPIEQVGKIYFALGPRFGFDRLRAAAESIVTDTPWQKAAISGVIDDLFNYQSVLAARVLQGSKKGANGEAIDHWLATRHDVTTRTDQMLNELRTIPAIDLSALTVATRKLRALIES
ncbi:MAG: NAD-glutamate dehydrogenase [Thermoanaerobaculia bacterium]